MGVLLCLYYNTEYMTVIVAFPKIYGEFFGGAVRRTGEVPDGFWWRRGMGITSKTTVWWWDETYTKNLDLSRIRAVGYFPPARALAFGIGNATERCHLSPLRLPSPVPRSLSTRGKPALLFLDY